MILYAITDPSILSFDTLSSDLQRIKARGATMILYRDKTTEEYAKRACQFVSEARKTGFEKILLHNTPELAAELGAWGVHFPSSALEGITRAKILGLHTLASCHTEEELESAQRLGVSMVTLSPLFPSPGKGEALGEERFRSMSGRMEIPVLALGGIIDEEKVRRALDCGAAGIASIRYFA